MTTQPALFEIPTDQTTHVLMPCMDYACGASMLDIEGHFTVGLTNLAKVDCADCLAVGADQIRAEIDRQQASQG